MKIKSIMKVILTVCALLIAAFACAGATPSAAVKAFYRAVADGNTDEAVDLLSEDVISMVGRQKLRSGLHDATRKIIEKGGLKDVQILEEKTSGDVANVAFLLKYGNGTQERETEQLVKERGSWRLKPHK